MLTRLRNIILASALMFAPVGLIVAQPAFAAPAASTCAPNTTDAFSAINAGINCAANDTNPAPAKTISDRIGNIINLMSKIVGVIAVIMVVVAGIQFVTSGGNKDGVTNAKKTITYAVVGLIIVAIAQVIVQFVLQSATTP